MTVSLSWHWSVAAWFQPLVSMSQPQNHDGSIMQVHSPPTRLSNCYKCVIRTIITCSACSENKNWKVWRWRAKEQKNKINWRDCTPPKTNIGTPKFMFCRCISFSFRLTSSGCSLVVIRSFRRDWSWKDPYISQGNLFLWGITRRCIYTYTYTYIYIYIARTWLSCIYGLQISKEGLVSIKTRVILVPGIYIYRYRYIWTFQRVPNGSYRGVNSPSLGV